MGSVYPENCTEVKVDNLKQVIDQVVKGARNRHISATNMNQQSSRSHTIFTAIIKQAQFVQDGAEKRPFGPVKKSRFHIIDLAGSERAKDTGA